MLKIVSPTATQFLTISKNTYNYLMNNLFQDYTPKEFEAQALKVFAFQYQNYGAYQEFCNYFGKTPKTVHALEEIPFLPIEVFKSKEI